eukprot:TRINITY_DN984_c0_g1_i1.p1 TRINITY_DN984_c0_g1~~TRINITY_DN984_c0_g1_i1.p1  ORF type:complete len:130 (-),score=36.62 TRINITY_DN984_c0_g1_i1:83-472(-)
MPRYIIIFHDGAWNKATSQHVDLISEAYAQIVFRENEVNIIKKHVHSDNFEFLAQGLVHYAPIHFGRNQYWIIYHENCAWHTRTTNDPYCITDNFAQVVVDRSKNIIKYHAHDKPFPLIGLVEYFNGKY